MKKIFTFLLISFVTLTNAQCWQSIARCNNHVIAIKTDGTLWAWGNNGYGAFGNGTTISNNSPTQIGTATNWQTLSGGGLHSLAIKTDGTLFGWGHNNFGQLGDGTNIDKYFPTLVSCFPAGMKEVSGNENLFSVYPNPAKDVLNFKNEINQSINKIIITDLLGRKILEQKGTITEVNIKELEKGLYQVILFSGEKSYSSKFIKE